MALIKEDKMMFAEETDADLRRALDIWSDYEQQHDLSRRWGETAGIEPITGRVWFGGSIQDVVAQWDADGIAAPLFFVRVGSETYYRKGAYR